ncbi:MAG: DNA mismatch repair protein MutS [Anaerolineae bacterium CG2_30_64_16]|nr:MAG: DNA mismatch repair protein MutS [Anaerolineae bacterium CG2_30_64_16]
MKAFLMYRERDFDLKRALPWNAQALTQDLALDTLFDAMALGDKFLREVVRVAVLSGVDDDLGVVLYRQDVLRDCLGNATIIRDLYALAVEAIEGEKKAYFYSYFSKHPDAILNRAIEVLQVFVGMLKRLRTIADRHASEFASEGFRAFFTMLDRELSDAYFTVVQDHLKELKFRGGALISAELGQGLKGASYALRKPKARKQHWLRQAFASRPPVYSFTIADRDESGARALSDLRDQGINVVANALAQSADHILSFFTLLRTELAFYIGCLNLHGQLVAQGEPVCFPLPAAPAERRHVFAGLYDVCLFLTLGQKVVGSALAAEDVDLAVITGANQGGKSTFLRSIGLAQLMMQCGMFVPAESFCANMCDALFTHYRREEDVTMTSGKLDEELGRMSEIVDHMTPNALLLFNESFAATNEREGSEIARQIVSALVAKRIKVFFVTHLYTLARGLYDRGLVNAVFLVAERRADGERTFRIIEGEPSQMSYGDDVYDRIFGNAEPSDSR